MLAASLKSIYKVKTERPENPNGITSSSFQSNISEADQISTPEATPPDDHFMPDSHIVASKQKRGKRSPTAPTQPKSPKHDLPTKKSEIAVGMVIF